MPIPAAPTSPLRQRLIDDMTMRRFSRETQRNYIRDVGRFATFLGRPPDTATADDVRRFQVEQSENGIPAPTMNSIVSALRFFFTQTVDRPDLAHKLFRMAHPRKADVPITSMILAIDPTWCYSFAKIVVRWFTSDISGAGIRAGG
jgi:site-specific recombinase XerD